MLQRGAAGGPGSQRPSWSIFSTATGTDQGIASGALENGWNSAAHRPELRRRLEQPEQLERPGWAVAVFDIISIVRGERHESTVLPPSGDPTQKRQHQSAARFVRPTAERGSAGALADKDGSARPAAGVILPGVISDADDPTAAY